MLCVHTHSRSHLPKLCVHTHSRSHLHMLHENTLPSHLNMLRVQYGINYLLQPPLQRSAMVRATATVPVHYVGAAPMTATV